jgi:hypothetical protein
LSLETRSSSGEVIYPLGKDAVGLLLYAEQGYMAVSAMRTERVRFKSGELGAASPEEKLEAFDSYIAYSGRYEVRRDRVLHHVELSILPNWVGGSQERYFEFSGDRLTLRTPPATAEDVEWIAIWERASG